MKKKNIKWIVTITILAFFITVLFSLGSQSVLENANIIVGLLIVLLFIFLGVFFDVIGVAVQSSNEEPFHAMASKKIKSAKTAKKMIKNSAKVSSFCNDVIGDICNIISGSAGIIVATELTKKTNINITITTLLISSLVAALTIGGKAIGKEFAVNKSEYIVSKVTKFLHRFKKK